MGVNCSSKEEPPPNVTPLLKEKMLPASDVTFGLETSSRSSDVVGLTTEDHYNGKSRVHRHLSASTSALKQLLTGGAPGTSKDPILCETEEEEKQEKANECLEQLWEECYDLSENIEQTSKRAFRYHTEFLSTGYHEGDEDDKKVVDLTSSLAGDLKKLPFKDIVYGMQSIVFSTDGKGQIDRGYLEKVRAGAHELSKTMSESYDLFVLSSKLENKLLIERSFRLWKDIFRMWTNTQAIAKKFEVQLFGEVSEGDANFPDDENIWQILDLLLNVFRRKQLKGVAGGLLERIEELRQELNEGYDGLKLRDGLMKVTAKHIEHS